MCDCDWPIMVNSNTGRLFIFIKVILKATEINLPKLLTTLSNWVCWRPVWHDDVIKWKHFPRYWPFVWGIHRSPVNSPHKGQWRGALMFSLICAQINGWVNNREAGDLRRHQAHCDVIIMSVTKTVIRPILHGHCYPSYPCGGPYGNPYIQSIWEIMQFRWRMYLNIWIYQQQLITPMLCNLLSIAAVNKKSSIWQLIRHWWHRL